MPNFGPCQLVAATKAEMTAARLQLTPLSYYVTLTDSALTTASINAICSKIALIQISWGCEKCIVHNKENPRADKRKMHSCRHTYD